MPSIARQGSERGLYKPTLDPKRSLPQNGQAPRGAICCCGAPAVWAFKGQYVFCAECAHEENERGGFE